MLRRSFGLLAALCFVLGAALGTMWVREEPWVAPPPPPGFPAWVTPARPMPSLLPAVQELELSRAMPEMPAFKRCEAREVLDWVPSLDYHLLDINWPAIEAAGMRPETWVRRAASPVGTFGSRLADVLTPIGLAFATDGFHVYVSTPADVERFGHMRHIGRFTFLTRADSATADALLERYLGNRRPSIVRVEADDRALRAAGVAFKAPDVFRVVTPTGAMLESTLRRASGRVPLRYEIRGDRLVISTAAALEAADRGRIRRVLISAIGLLGAFAIALLLARRHPGRRRFLSVVFVLIVAFAIALAIWRARPDLASARVGHSRWAVGLGPKQSFVLTPEPERLEAVFLNHQSSGPAGKIYFNRLGFFVAGDGPPYHSLLARGPRWAVIGIMGALPLAWFGLNVPALVTLPRRIRARRRARSGRCPGCGYDLRGCMSGRCPECGAAIQGANSGSGVLGVGQEELGDFGFVGLPRRNGERQ